MVRFGSYLQGYNGQAVVSEGGLIVAAELTQDPADDTQLAPMLQAAQQATAEAGFRGPIGTLLADAGYWSEANITEHGSGRDRARRRHRAQTTREPARCVRSTCGSGPAAAPTWRSWRSPASSRSLPGIC